MIHKTVLAFALALALILTPALAHAPEGGGGGFIVTGADGNSSQMAQHIGHQLPIPTLAGHMQRFLQTHPGLEVLAGAGMNLAQEVSNMRSLGMILSLGGDC